MLHRIAFALLCMLGACATTESSSEPNRVPGSAALSGTVDGRPWTFQVGEIHGRGANGSFLAYMFASTNTPCSGANPPNPALAALIPPHPGDYAMDDPGARVNFLGTGDVDHPGKSRITPAANEGRLAIETVTETRVTGRLRASYDSDNAVDGTFELTVCPGS
jgi:hypothetical protein